MDAYVAGRPAAVSAIETVAGRFAKGVAAMRAILDPQVVVIGRPIARCGGPLLEAPAVTHQPLNQPPLAVSSLGHDGVVYGGLHHRLAEVERSRFERGRSSIRRAAVRGPVPGEVPPAAASGCSSASPSRGNFGNGIIQGVVKN
ncbi:hypothetical protein AB0F43_11065 [Kribbella sp. NPDC023972]|uniref:hypothetical protein n=1 Tax=Kribbella sp. NPDC023972 TaxID=3154795 RepID=UPI0033D797E6